MGGLLRWCPFPPYAAKEPLGLVSVGRILMVVMFVSANNDLTNGLVTRSGFAGLPIRPSWKSAMVPTVCEKYVLKELPPYMLNSGGDIKLSPCISTIGVTSISNWIFGSSYSGCSKNDIGKPLVDWSKLKRWISPLLRKRSGAISPSISKLAGLLLPVGRNNSYSPPEIETSCSTIFAGATSTLAPWI